ncbi:hypothetical protein EV421DRAFT_1754883 [Armillaria borealis]|uniref:Uncharacterized protein n=1 Tax=Armillaria borealis TaxID=47425 RepID=A0AA39N481_9AGAR|nr:hypothetical protein EV421DRAFT_1754883 [Armillaria borealis]
MKPVIVVVDTPPHHFLKYAASAPPRYADTRNSTHLDATAKHKFSMGFLADPESCTNPRTRLTTDHVQSHPSSKPFLENVRSYSHAWERYLPRREEMGRPSIGGVYDIFGMNIAAGGVDVDVHPERRVCFESLDRIPVSSRDGCTVLPPLLLGSVIANLQHLYPL